MTAALIQEDGTVPQLLVDMLIASEPWREGDADHALQITEAAERVLDHFMPGRGQQW